MLQYISIYSPIQCFSQNTKALILQEIVTCTCVGKRWCTETSVFTRVWPHTAIHLYGSLYAASAAPSRILSWAYFPALTICTWGLIWQSSHICTISNNQWNTQSAFKVKIIWFITINLCNQYYTYHIPISSYSSEQFEISCVPECLPLYWNEN